MVRLPYLLADIDGRLVYGRLPGNQQLVSAAELKTGIPIEVNGETVGYLLSAKALVDWERSSPQGIFLSTVNQAILIGAIGAILVSLVLGALLARSLTSPLHALAEATRRVAQGALGIQVPVRSNDEIGQLTGSFNRMSSDLEKSNRLRKQMTADIAHDLRNPLSILLGYTEALSDGKLSGTPEMYDTMHDSAGQLSRLVDDLRTLSLADAGELPIQPQQVEPLAMLERARQSYAAKAEAQGVSLQVQAAGDLPTVRVDPERMAQVFANLVSNALRYTPYGGLIELSAAVDGGDLLLRVRDTGTGIAPEDLPNVFNRFYRGDPSRQNNGDAGLGLTIAKSLVTAQGGEISVESRPGEGATFTMRFPVG
jgi:signal transduction histidine kinase